MHQNSLLLLGLTSSLIFTACGSGLSKLTEEQKNSVKQTLHSAQSSYDAANHAAVKSNPKLTNNFSLLNLIRADVNPARNYVERSSNQLAMQSRIQEGVTEQKCSVQASSITQSQFEIPQITISGQGCPITFNLSAKVDQDKQTASIHLDYQVQEGDYRKLNDIDAASLDFSGKFEKDSGSMKFNGKLHSQLQNEIKLEGEFEGSKTKGQARLRLDYPKFSAEFKIEGSEHNTKYSLNGEEITQEQFNSYLTYSP